MNKLWKNNGLSIVFLILFLVSWGFQVLTGQHTYNQQKILDGETPINLVQYLHTGHFIQASFENWESEFLQMALFVIATIFLYQKGSSESKDPDHPDKEISTESSTPTSSSPAIGNRFLSWMYSHSLSLALLLLFLVSFVFHWYGSWQDENEQLASHQQPMVSAVAYLGFSRFWFESFQNWQSEFLSVLAIVLLSIFLRQKGSPQSKSVEASNRKTGE